MENIKKIQDTLNSNPDEAKAFHKDPVSYLEGKGVALSEGAKDHLNKNIKGSTPGKPFNVGIMVG